MSKRIIRPSQYIDRSDAQARDFDDHWTVGLKVKNQDQEADSAWSDINAYSFKISYWRSWQKLNKETINED